MSDDAHEMQPELDRRIPELKAATAPIKLRSIGEFCPKGMQIRSPGGLCFDPKDVCGLAAYTETNDGRDELVIYLPTGQVSVTFHGHAPDVYKLMRNIQAAK